jgi:hypothetical protein
LLFEQGYGAATGVRGGGVDTYARLNEARHVILEDIRQRARPWMRRAEQGAAISEHCLLRFAREYAGNFANLEQSLTRSSC